MIVSVFRPESNCVRRMDSTLAGSGAPWASLRASSPTSRMSVAPSSACGWSGSVLISASAGVRFVLALNWWTVNQAVPTATNATVDTKASPTLPITRQTRGPVLTTAATPSPDVSQASGRWRVRRATGAQFTQRRPCAVIGPLADVTGAVVDVTGGGAPRVITVGVAGVVVVGVVTVVGVAVSST